MIDFKCQYCGEMLRMNDSFAGRDGWCRACKRMVIVPLQGRAMKVEELPPGEAIARLQKLLQYAARKADQHKHCLEQSAAEEQLRSAVESAREEAREKIAAEHLRCAQLEADAESLRGALSEAESRQRERAQEGETAAIAAAESAKARLAELETALTAERALRAALDIQRTARDEELDALRNALAEEHAAGGALLQQLQRVQGEVGAVQDSLELAHREMDRSESEASVLRQQLRESQEACEQLVALRESAQRKLDAFAELEGERASIEARLEACEGLLLGAQREKVGLEDSLVSLRGAHEKLESEVRELKRRLKDAEEERAQLLAVHSDFSGRSERPVGDAATSMDHGETVRVDTLSEETEKVPAEESFAPGAESEAPNEGEAAEGTQREQDCAAKRRWAILPGEIERGASQRLHVSGNARLGKATKNMGKEAFVERWHREAEVPGASQAQFRLGARYERGLGVTQNHAEAIRWYLRAAEQGHVGAQYHLGRMYADGRGVVKNPTMALDWFRRAAEQGDAGAQCELGVLCITGTGVSRDDEAAMGWFRKAAEQGNAAALYHLGLLYIEGATVPSNASLAYDYFQRAAEKGHADAQHRVGQMLIDGIVTARDECRALELFSKAAEQGHLQAQYALGTCLERGRGAVQNYIRAYAWYNLAAVRLDQARAARDRLATLMLPEQILQGQQLAEEMHIKQQADELDLR